jgi:hypothetical protein
LQQVFSRHQVYDGEGVDGFQFCVAAAQHVDCILAIRDRNAKQTLGLLALLNRLPARGDYTANVFKTVQDAEEGRYLLYFEVE